ncbi:MAG: flagellar protein FlgN [Planctomycetaceae bacterium]|nr:flagellar protein FlgN [Planctomycetaceae bacterium]
MKTDIKTFLTQLAESQSQMLTVLHKKQAILVKPEKDALPMIAAEEEKVLGRMQAMLDRREELLTTARLRNVPCDSIEQLCGHFFPNNFEIQKVLAETRHRTQQISLLAYTNWTMSRKSLIHVSQILELLETRGQGKTTYQPQPKSDRANGSFVDRVA